MKILILASGGGDAHRRTLAALVAGAASRDDVRVLAPDAEGTLLRALGVPIESWKPAGLFNVLGSIVALRRAVQRRAPDAIHAVGWSAAAVALGALSPAQAARTLVTVLDPIREGEMPKAFVDKRLPELLQRAGLAICAYRSLASTLCERFGVAPERVEIVPPGVAPSPNSIDRPTSRRGPLLGYLSAVEGDAAWERAVEALALVKSTLADARLSFFAVGSERHRVRAFARARGVSESMTYFNGVPVAAFLAGIDLVLVPTARDGLPYALPQALVDGVPVIATNHGGLADTLGPFTTGWLVPDGAAGLAAGVLDAWPRIDAAWAGARAQRATAIAEFDPSRVIQRTHSAYNTLAVLGPREEQSISQTTDIDRG